MEKPVSQPCPTEQQLAAFAAGKLDAALSSDMEQHLAECASCCQLLKLIPDEGTLVGLLRGGQVASRADCSPGFSPGEAPTLLPAQEQATLPPGAGATAITAERAAPGPAGVPAALAQHARYRITRLLGRGGMGDVYEAHHRMMNRTVALKVISSQLVSSPAAIGRFHREVQAAARLSHPNIVAAYDAEQAGDVHFLVMEFVEGTDLAALVQQNGPLPVAQACDFIRQAAEGLEHAHRQGMVHRDIKPQNLMVTGLRIGNCGLRIEDGEEAVAGQSAIRNPKSAIVKILDFGLANFASESAAEQFEQGSGQAGEASGGPQLTLMGSMMGTPDYMAPEQARDAHSADIRSDIYSLGCTLHFLLTGQTPFSGGSVLEKVMAHVQREPTPLRECRDDVPAGLQAVVGRMLAKDPAERFQTPADVAAALAAFTQQTPTEPQTAPPRRRTWIAIASLAAATLLAGAIYIVTDKGQIEIRSEVEDVKVVVSRGGEQIKVIDLATGSQIEWLPSGEYAISLKPDRNDVKIENGNFQMSRWGRQIVSLTRKPPAAAATSDKSRLNSPPRAVAPFSAEQALAHQSAWAQFLGIPKEETNSIGMKLRLVPPGEFALHPKLRRAPQTGSNLVEQPFYAGLHEVTVGQFHAFSEATGFKTSAETDGLGATRAMGLGRGLKRDASTTWRHPDLSGDDRQAVGCVTWNDAVAFCRWLSAKEGRTYRLPTESEWIWLARGGSSGLYFFGEDTKELPTYAWFSTKEAPLDRPQPVGLKPANSWGLYDVHGNVGELCYDWLNSNGTSRRTLATAPDGPAIGDRFLQRGGGYHDVLDSGNYSFFWGAAMSHIGFRVILEVENTQSPSSAASPTVAPARAGLLTNPPRLPPEGVAVGRNLIIDPSLEETPTAQLPPGWFAWLNDGPNFKCEVVEGGASGKHCLQISGTGTRGVVFATTIPLDRTKRYALKGRLKVEGDAGTWATVKLNYFNAGGWLGVDDRVGVTTSDFDWQLLEKTDAADRFPAATLLVPTCHLEGNGTAWFDDLEVIAYDRETLPADFDATHGKNNRMR